MSRETGCTSASLVGLAAALVVSFAAQAASTFSDFHAVTSVAENSCLATTAATNGDDCSYNASNPGGQGTRQWIGPTFSAGYYASGAGPAVYVDPSTPSPVTAPAALLPTGGKTGIPVTGYLEIRDAGTPTDPTDDVIAGNLTFGAFDRNVGLGDGTRALEHFTKVSLDLTAATVRSATPNAGGGIDYVIGLGVPAPLTGSTTGNGGFADSFPSEVASQSSADPADVPYWSAAGMLGVASFEGNVGTSTQPAVITGYSCTTNAGAGPVACTTGALNWDTAARAAFENVLIRVSTDATGAVTAGNVVLVNEFTLLPASTGSDSWQALTVDITSAALRPTAVDDAAPLNGVNPITVNVLANDLNLSNSPVTVVQSVAPKRGTIVINPDNTVTYTPNAGTVSDTFQYSVRNAAGFSSAPALVRVGNDVPVAHDDVADFGTARFNTVYNAPIITIDYKANDTGLGDTPITAAIVGPQPAHGGALIDAAQAMIYKAATDAAGAPTPGIFPAEHFMYSITDANGDSSSASVTVRGFFAGADGTTVGQELNAVAGLPLTIDILANDFGRTDSPVVVEITGPPAHGKVRVNADNSVTYTPDPGYRGRLVQNFFGQLVCQPNQPCADLFQYTLRNAEGDFSSATVAVNVFPPPETSKGSSLDPWSLAGLLGFAALGRRRRSRAKAR